MPLRNKTRSNRGASQIAEIYRMYGYQCEIQPNSGADARWPGDGKSSIDLWEYKTSKRKLKGGTNVITFRGDDWLQILREANSQNLPPAMHVRAYKSRYVWTAFVNPNPYYYATDDFAKITRSGNIVIKESDLIRSGPTLTLGFPGMCITPIGHYLKLEFNELGRTPYITKVGKDPNITNKSREEIHEEYVALSEGFEGFSRFLYGLQASSLESDEDFMKRCNATYGRLSEDT